MMFYYNVHFTSGDQVNAQYSVRFILLAMHIIVKIVIKFF